MTLQLVKKEKLKVIIFQKNYIKNVLKDVSNVIVFPLVLNVTLLVVSILKNKKIIMLPVITTPPNLYAHI